jgi:hypothetical protein
MKGLSTWIRILAQFFFIILLYAALAAESCGMLRGLVCPMTNGDWYTRLPNCAREFAEVGVFGSEDVVGKTVFFD